MVALAQEVIEFQIVEHDLGVMLIAKSSNGICRLTMGDSHEELMSNLQEHFPTAVIEVTSHFTELAQQVLATAQKGEQLDVELDLRGTTFQKKVWAELRRIPRGTTISYQQLAERIGHPTAVRAVGTACGANPVSILVPCHRVVRTDGHLNGYRWGLDRKAALLKWEGVPVRV